MLTDSKVRALKPNGKVQKVSDGGGLYAQVSPAGSILWRFGYRFEGKQKSLCIGKYPIISLAAAREATREAHVLLSQGIDPAAKKQEDKKAQGGNALTFEKVGKEWYDTKTLNNVEKSREQKDSRLKIEHSTG